MPPTFAQGEPAADLQKEKTGQERDTVIVLDSSDSKGEAADPLEMFRRPQTATQSTAAKSSVTISRAVSKQKAPKDEKCKEGLKPVQAKDKAPTCNEDDISFHLYETIKCVGCLQPPISPKQCASCQNLTCSTCYQKSKKCISCGSISSGPVKDKILLSILDKFVLFSHQCSPNDPLKTYSQTEMDLHQKSASECTSKKYRCFCKSKDEGFTMFYSEIARHLKAECDKVRIQCHQC